VETDDVSVQKREQDFCLFFSRWRPQDLLRLEFTGQSATSTITKVREKCWLHNRVTNLYIKTVLTKYPVWFYLHFHQHPFSFRIQNISALHHVTALAVCLSSSPRYKYII